MVEFNENRQCLATQTDVYIHSWYSLHIPNSSNLQYFTDSHYVQTSHKYMYIDRYNKNSARERKSEIAEHGFSVNHTI